MPGIKDDRDDSDGEEMEHESADSDKSSSSSDSSDGSDSDDSSEMDEEECERRRTECMENLADLERQFTLLREQLYRERVSQVETKLGEVRCGRAHEYLQPLEELQDNMRVRMEVAGILRKFRLANIHNKAEAEELASNQNYESEKSLLWDCIYSDLEDKIRRLEDDRNNTDISSGLWLETLFRRSRKHGNSSHHTSSHLDMTPLSERRRKPITVSGPYIVYMLAESEILEDWTIIKKALAKRKSEIHL
ncbi:hypothetical protein B566_EDAN006876 [Ephemera danica]|nr:hypothetical protein B566_EDAN006876 [Ephemera danica]